jgi:hypothetical protein
MSYLCPTCNRSIYNRRNKICGFCSAKLPPELLFSAAEIEAMDKEEAVLKEFHQKQKAEREVEELARKQAAQRQSDFMTGYFLGKL